MKYTNVCVKGKVYVLKSNWHEMKQELNMNMK